MAGPPGHTAWGRAGLGRITLDQRRREYSRQAGVPSHVQHARRHTASGLIFAQNHRVFNHNMATFLCKMAVKSEKMPTKRRFPLAYVCTRLAATLCLSRSPSAKLWVKLFPGGMPGSKER